MRRDHLAGLNKAQLKAVRHGMKRTRSPRPILVIAGAGSGKTKVIAAHVAQLLASGADPRRILLLTFSRRAANEMTKRVRLVTKASKNGADVALPWAGTFHSIADRLLRQYGQRIGVRSSFTILDRSDAEDLMDIVRHDLGLSAKELLFPNKATCLAIYSLAVNSCRPVKRVLVEKFPSSRRWRKDLKKLFAAYVDAKKKQNVLDFDDLLLRWAELLAVPKLASELGGLFDHILVDEYQDTNRLQAKILHRLKPNGRGVMVVGDDAQSIYSFRAADVRNILDFPEQFDRTVRMVTLEQNYRSTQPLLSACNEVIGLAKERFTKNLFSERESDQKPFLTTVNDDASQAQHVATCILESREAGVPLKSQAVLFRASHHSAQLEIELAKRNIPFVKWGGVKFLEAAHIKDVVSILRWCQNPRDRIAGSRVLRLLPGVGPQTAAELFNRCAGRGFARKLRTATPPKATTKEWPAFARLISNVRKGRNAWPAEIESVCKWYGPHLDRIHDDGGWRESELNQLAQIAASYPSREVFLRELSIDPPDAASGRARANVAEEDYLVLSTIHSAKGGEWRHVTILNVVEGCIPHTQATKTSDEVEEERRLLYVAMTRAKDELDLVVPQRHFTHQRSASSDVHYFTKCSRFIPSSIHKYFETRRRVGFSVKH